MPPDPVSERADASPEPSSLINVLRIVRERWWLVALTTIVGFAVALGASLQSTKQYTATATLLVKPSNLPALIDPSQTQATDSATLARIQADDVSLVTSTAVARQAQATLHTSLTIPDLLSEVSATADSSDDLINIQATDPDPARAARIANAFATATTTYLTDTAQAQLVAGQAKLQSELAALPASDPGRPALEQGLKQVIALRAVTNGGATVVESAQPPGGPSAPSVKRDAIVGGVAGLAVGLLIIFLMDLFDRRLKTAESIERLYGLSALAAVPLLRRRVRPGSRSSQAELEPFRILRDGLEHVSLRQDMRVVLVSSAISGEGKTRVAAGLARAIAAAGKRVALVEGDVHRPGVRKEFGLGAQGPGLMNALVEGGDADSLVQRVANIPYLSILPSGPFTPNSAELLRLPAMTEVLSQLTADHDFVIIDGAPLLPVADSQVLLDNAMIDVILLVARPFLTTREHIRLSLSVIARHPDKGVGLAINGVRKSASGYYGYTGEYQDADALLPEVLGGGSQSRRTLRRRRERPPAEDFDRSADPSA
ncbi:MAG TPA: Wzz/FepE/Etk N-terminal domain-containing protein [Solirubrobacteraceae bacterium]|nr:Wzz/FepE/Etk N-terminal domain-containing protein [Solirubrobacteraceae bacterium]